MCVDSATRAGCCTDTSDTNMVAVPAQTTKCSLVAQVCTVRVPPQVRSLTPSMLPVPFGSRSYRLQHKKSTFSAIAAKRIVRELSVDTVQCALRSRGTPNCGILHMYVLVLMRTVRWNTTRCQRVSWDSATTFGGTNYSSGQDGPYFSSRTERKRTVPVAL